MHALTGFRLWRQGWRHFLGPIFCGGISPPKIGLITPYWDTARLRSTACAFLFSGKRGNFFVSDAPTAFIRGNNNNLERALWVFAVDRWVSNQARVKASGNILSCFLRDFLKFIFSKYFWQCKNQRSFWCGSVGIAPPRSNIWTLVRILYASNLYNFARVFLLLSPSKDFHNIFENFFFKLTRVINTHKILQNSL